VVASDVAAGGAIAEVHGLGPNGMPAIAGADASEHGAVLGLRRGAVVDEYANQYGAAAVASEGELAASREVRRVGVLVRLRGADDCFEVARGSCEDV
jgi:hypothetical protein